MIKKISFLLVVFAFSTFAFGQDQTNTVVGKHTFISAYENLNELANSVNNSYQLINNPTGSRTSTSEAQTNYKNALINYLNELEKFASTCDASIKDEVNAEINLVKELQVPTNR